MHVYSPYFTTLYDQQEPVGDFGRGIHYSVLRAVSWHSPHDDISKRPYHFDFAIIWDEDHDTRVIAPVEEIYLAGLLSKFIFFGERKANFTAVLDHNVNIHPGDREFNRKISNIVEHSAEGDFWHTEIQQYAEVPRDPCDAEWIFHSNIRMLWKLGGKPIAPRGAAKADTPPPPPTSSRPPKRDEPPQDMTMDTGTYEGTFPWPKSKSQ